LAIYHFSNQIISRKKQQNTIAAAAYRSGDSLVEERTGEVKFYNREVKPVTHILAPAHAPDWVNDRERLWNEVEKKERQWNAQLAREVNIALPKELSHEQQERLAVDFCRDIFVNDGMVADLSIHRDDRNNPHFHVMLTIRPFNEDGSWGNKQKKVKEMVNGKRQVKALHTTDWNTKEKLMYWREQWAVYANRSLEANGHPERITHLSNKDRGLETLPTVHEGFVARQMEAAGKDSDRIKMNKERKEYNKTVVELAEAKRQKQARERNEKFVRRFTPSEKKQLRDSARVLRMFVNYENINQRRKQLLKWQARLEFSQDSLDKLRKLNRIETETEILDQAENILAAEGNRFLDKYYPDTDKAALTRAQKIELVEASVSENRKLHEQEIRNVCSRVEKKSIEDELNILLNNRPKFVLLLKRGIKNAEVEFERLRSEHQIDFRDNLSIRNAPKQTIPKMQSLLKQKQDFATSMDLMDELYDLQLLEMYPNWEGRNYLTLEQKEFFVMAKEYYGKTILPADFQNPPRKYMQAEQREIIHFLHQTNRDVGTKKSEAETGYEHLKVRYPEFQIDNESYRHMFYLECLRHSAEIGTDAIKQLEFLFGMKPSSTDSNFVTSVRMSQPDYVHVPETTIASDFFSILENAIREADRKWRDDEFEQRLKNKKKKRQKGMER
jgi:hypothetical protein